MEFVKYLPPHQCIYFKVKFDWVVHRCSGWKIWLWVLTKAYWEWSLSYPLNQYCTRLSRLLWQVGMSTLCIGKVQIVWVGQFKGKNMEPTVVMEAIADSELWIWGSFFGFQRSLKDIIVLDQSSIDEDIIKGDLSPYFFLLRCIAEEDHFAIIWPMGYIKAGISS